MMMLVGVLCGIIASLIMPSTALSTTYYLNPGPSAIGGSAAGSDSANGSFATPWKTLFKVKSSVTAGDVVNVLGGTWTAAQYKGEAGNPVWSQAHGKGVAGNPITIQANPGDTVTFDGQLTAYWMIFNTNTAGYGGHYIIINNLKFTNYDAAIIGIGHSGVLRTHHVVIQNCDFRNISDKSGAALATMLSEYVIFKNNVIVNSGDRSLGWNSALDNQHGIYPSQDPRYLVMEGNYIEKVDGMNISGYIAGSTTTATNWIIRKNTLVNGHYANLALTGSGAQTFANTYVYHNTMYNEAVPFAAVDSAQAKANIEFHGVVSSYTNINIKNNILYGYANQGNTWSDQDAWFGGTLTWDYNLVTNLNGTSANYKWAGTTYTLAGFQGATPYADHDKGGDPLFTNPASPTRNFTLQNTSPAKNAGTFLTTAVGAGTTSTSLTVVDAGYFHDGYGMITGDVIQVGAVTTTITNVNYSTNVLTISPAISWSNGAAITFVYSGSAPDMGAFEVAETPPSTPTVGGVDFDGVDDYLDMSTNAAYRFANTNAAVTGWFTSNNDDGYVFAKRALSAGGEGYYFFRINSNGTGTARLAFDGATVSAEVTSSLTTLKDGTKHCFGVIFNTSTTVAAQNQIDLYIDGVLVGTSGPGTNVYSPNNQKLVFGALSDFDSSGWLRGGVEDLRIWGPGMTGAMITRYCQAKMHYFSVPLATVSYWPLDTCAEGASGGGVTFPDRMKGGSNAVGVVGGTGTGLTCHGSNTLNYVSSTD